MAIMRGTVTDQGDGYHGLMVHERLRNGTFDIVSAGDFYICLDARNKSLMRGAHHALRRLSERQKTVTFYYIDMRH